MHTSVAGLLDGLRCCAAQRRHEPLGRAGAAAAHPAAVAPGCAAILPSSTPAPTSLPHELRTTLKVIRNEIFNNQIQALMAAATQAWSCARRSQRWCCHRRHVAGHVAGGVAGDAAAHGPPRDAFPVREEPELGPSGTHNRYNSASSLHTHTPPPAAGCRPPPA